MAPKRLLLDWSLADRTPIISVFTLNLLKLVYGKKSAISRGDSGKRKRNLPGGNLFADVDVENRDVLKLD